MNESHVLPELKEIVGAVLFAAKQPVSLAQLHALMRQTAERMGGVTRDFAAASERDVATALESLRSDLDRGRCGLRVAEVAQGFRMENTAACGPWLRTFLDRGRPARLSHPALETLAIVAYRQPIMRSEIESVRGVAVDQILRNLLDMQLIRVAGRSDLPGRPWLFGTTQKFLEHFGLRSLDDLPGVDELRRMEAARSEAPMQEEMALGAEKPSTEPAPFVGFDQEGEDAPAEIEESEGEEEEREGLPGDDGEGEEPGGRRS